MCFGNVPKVPGNGTPGSTGDIDTGLPEIRDVDTGGLCDVPAKSAGLGRIAVMFGFRANDDDTKGPIAVLPVDTDPGVDLFGGSKGLALTCFTSSD